MDTLNLNLKLSQPAYSDHESVTAIQAIANVIAKVNEVVANVNAFSEKITSDLESHKTKTEQTFEVFAIGLRQEFQDFINVTELNLGAVTKSLDELSNGFESELENIVKSKLAEYEITTDLYYDEVTEGLSTFAIITAPIIITKQPVGGLFNDGEYMTLTIEASGKDLTYKWFSCSSSGVPLELYGVESTLTREIYKGDEFYFKCIVSDSEGNTLESDLVEVKFGE